MKIILFIGLYLLIVNIGIANTNTNTINFTKAIIINDLQKTAENVTHVIAGKLLDNKVGKIINSFIGGNWIGDLIHGRFNSKNIEAPLISDTPSSIEVYTKSELTLGCATTNNVVNEKMNLPLGFEVVEINEIYKVKLPDRTITLLEWKTKEGAIIYTNSLVK